MISRLKWLLGHVKAWFQVLMGLSDSKMLQVHMVDPPITASLGPIDRLISQLQSLEGSKHNLPVEFSTNEIGLLIKHLKEFCTPMKYLSEMDNTSFIDKWWMKEVRELCYDTEDYLEEVILQYGVSAPRTWTRLLLEDVRIPVPLGRVAGVIIFWVHSKLKWRPQLSHFLTRAKVLKGRCPSSEEKEKAGDITFNREFKADISLKKEDRPDIETLTAQLVEKLAFGDKKTQLKVVPIYGFPGAGKTILARTLYAKYKRRFHCWAFVQVSRNPDIRSILTSILSQIKAPTGSPAPEVQDLIVNISTHLKRKRYFIVIDDVRRTSVWDIISRVFPRDNCGSRIIITTEIEHVASACSGYELVSTIFKMDSVNACTDTITSKQKNEALNFSYNNLPLHLKTCLLYLSMYPEGCTITKDDLVKQWVAEGLIAALKRQERAEIPEIPQNETQEIAKTSQYKTAEIVGVPQDKGEDISEILQDKGEEIAQISQNKIEQIAEVRQEETKNIAGSYFDELVTRGMIQPVDRNHKSEVLSCTVHHMVLDLIRYKSKENNFIVVVDNLESTLGHPDIVRRLSVQFGCEKGASLPENIILSQVRSLTFYGFLECVPHIADYGLLRVLMLHIWADEDKIFDVTGIGELYHLRYLKIECNITIRLPSKIRRLQHLSTLELHAEVIAIPSDIGHLEKLVHVRCPSNDNVMRGIGELTNLLDLQITCSTVENLECLRSILEKLSSLRCLALVPASRSWSVNTLPVNPSRMCISCDSLCIVSPAPAHLQRLELLRHWCIFSRLPKWIGELHELCVLKIAVRELSGEDIDILKGMPSLTALSLHVKTMPAERIVFGKEGFSYLTYFKFTCTVPWLKFEACAMPNLEKLKLCFTVPLSKQCFIVPIVDEQGTAPIIIERLLGLKEISAIICSVGADAESIWQEAISNDLGNPEVQVMDSIYYGDQGREMVTTEQEHRILEQLDESMEEDDEIKDKGLGGREIMEDSADTDEAADRRIHIVPESSSSRLPVPAGHDALQVFASGVGLGDGVVDLEEKLRNAGVVLGAARKIEIQNEAMVQSLPQLQRLIYDAEEVLDEIDYFHVQADFNADEEMLDDVDNPMCDDDDEINKSSGGGSDASSPVAHADVDEQGSSNTDFNADEEMLDDVDDPMCDDDDDINESSGGGSDDSSPVAHAVVDEQGSSNAFVPAYGHATVRTRLRAEFDRYEMLPQIYDISRLLGDFTSSIRDALKLEELDGIALAKHGYENTRRLTTPYLTVTKIFGRDRERDQIIRLLMCDAYRNRTLTVLPVVGNGGIGKTALAQYVFSDPTVETYFDMKIWVCVSQNFDVVRVTRQMLECVTRTGHEGNADLNILQEILKYELKGSRVLLVLDDIWDIKDSSEWSRLVAPLGSNQPGEGNVILVTTRNQSVMKVVGAMGSIALDGLEREAFWDCFRAYAFGKEKEQKKLHHIGMQIADRLKGNPLAAKSVGGLLRKNISFERWTRILESKEWISHQNTEGITAILKFSYDYLPFHLRQCFSYCSLFPKSYQIYAQDLVHLWISQGFVYPVGDNRRLEEVGYEYLDDLVNLGFFEKVDKDKTGFLHYLIHDLMHELAQDVSSKECFTMDDSQCAPMPPTVRHLSIITTPQYSDFEKDVVQLSSLLSKKLTSLMVFGSFGSTFVTSFHFMTDVTRNLRTLRLSGIEDDGDILSGFGHCIHLRYLRATKQENDKPNPWFERSNRQFPKELSRLYRLQYLNVGVDCHLSNLTKSFSNLVNLRHFICHEESHSEISNVSKLACLQELLQFTVRNNAGFQIAQLGNLLDLGLLRIYGLENLETKEEANSAGLLEREHLRSLQLSWDASRVSDNPNVIKEVLEGLEPHPKLNHLQISGYMSASPPAWLGEASPLTHLQSIYLEDCKLLRTLPAFAHLKCLKKLHLSRICGAPDVSTHSLEELVIEEVEELERWIIRDELPLLASELQVLEIKGCPKLTELPISCYSTTKTVAIPVFSLLHRLIIHDCPLLMPLPPLPLGPKVLKMITANVGSALYKSLSYYQFKNLSYYQTLILDGGKKLRTQNGVLALHNLGALSELSLISCSNLNWISWAEAFWQLKYLKTLNFKECPNFLLMPATQEEKDYMKDHSLPAIEKLTIESCCINWNWFGHVLSLLPSLSYLELIDCRGEEDDECMLLIPPGSLTSLKELCVANCVQLSCGSNEGLRGLISLEKLTIRDCPKLMSSLMPENTDEEGGSLSRSILLPSSLQELMLDGVNHKFLCLSCLTSLKELAVIESSHLESLDLHSCTALEEIRIHSCGTLSSVQGLQTCIHLRSLQVYNSPGFWNAWSHAMQDLERVHHDVFCPQVERIWTDDPSLLTSCSCKFLTSLERLGFLLYENDGDVRSTMEDPNLDFQLLTSLLELEFNSCSGLHSLPMTLHLLPSLKKLAIKSCERIESLEELVLLPASLEVLHISDCESLQSLPARLNCLHSFKKLEILCCPGILSLQEQRLPPSLEEMIIESCENLQSLPGDLHQISSLSKLEIKSCPGIKSLPENGLPSALVELWVWDCNEELKEQCKKIRNMKRMSHIYVCN